MRAPIEEQQTSSADELARRIASADFTGCTATVVGIGTMGKHFVAALRALGVPRIRIVSRSPKPLESFSRIPGIETVSCGVERLMCQPEPRELGIIATPTALLGSAAERLAALGFHRLLVEKPVSLWTEDLERLAERFERDGLEAYCAYNRIAYPSLLEVRARAAQEGGITSCAYTFTEMIKPDWPQRFPAEELARWGIANSLHVMSMAHGLIGWPSTWTGHRSGSLPWHPAGAVFVGSGVSERGVPFSYHADWGSTGRWSVEVHTPVSSYRLCPLEKVFRRTAATADWVELPVAAFAVELKTGIAEEVAAVLNEDVRASVPLISLRAAAALTRYGEAVFGYPNNPRRS